MGSGEVKVSCFRSGEKGDRASCGCWSPRTSRWTRGPRQLSVYCCVPGACCGAGTQPTSERVNERARPMHGVIQVSAALRLPLLGSPRPP